MIGWKFQIFYELHIFVPFLYFIAHTLYNMIYHEIPKLSLTIEKNIKRSFCQSSKKLHRARFVAHGHQALQQKINTLEFSIFQTHLFSILVSASSLDGNALNKTLSPRIKKFSKLTVIQVHSIRCKIHPKHTVIKISERFS